MKFSQSGLNRALWLQNNAWTHLPDHVFQIFDIKMRATAFDLVWEVTKSRLACKALQDGDGLSGLGVCQMWGLGARVDRQGPSFCRRGSGAQLSSGESTSLNVPLSINQFWLRELEKRLYMFLRRWSFHIPHFSWRCWAGPMKTN